MNGRIERHDPEDFGYRYAVSRSMYPQSEIDKAIREMEQAERRYRRDRILCWTILTVGTVAFWWTAGYIVTQWFRHHR